MKNCCLPDALFIMLSGCGNSNKNEAAQPDTQVLQDSTTNVKPTFFPVTAFLKGQMVLLDSAMVTPLKITTVKGKTDSEWIKMPQLKIELQTFLTPEINDSNMTRFFKETKFNDLTVNAITF